MSAHRRNWIRAFSGFPHIAYTPAEQQYSVSSDGNKDVFVRGDQGERSPVWVAALDGSSSPRALASIDGVIAYFGTPGSVIFAGREGAFGFLYRIREDGGGLEKLASSSILYLYGISPDQKWIAEWVPGSTPETRNSVLAIPVQGGAPVVICGNGGGAGSQRRGHGQLVARAGILLSERQTTVCALRHSTSRRQRPPADPGFRDSFGYRCGGDTWGTPGLGRSGILRSQPLHLRVYEGTTQRSIYRVGLP